MHKFGDALKSAGLSRFSGHPGDVYLVVDKDVVIPETTLPGAKERKYHDTRTCVVLSNEYICGDPMYPILSIAPTSHRVDLKDAADFQLAASSQNGLDVDSIVMLGHIQPMKKASCVRRIGKLTPDEWEALVTHLLWNIAGE